jgi:tRNA G18 (ribose-2'-O)-methylase SpoU
MATRVPSADRLPHNRPEGIVPVEPERRAMPRFEHIRHKPPGRLAVPRELVVACAAMRSHVNLSHIVRTCGCFGIGRVIACGAAGIHGRIARDGAESVEVAVHRSLPPVLDRLRDEGYELVGLEQATHAENLFAFRFAARTVLVIGNERTGLDQAELDRLDRVAEIPMAGMPHSLNAATSAAVAIYEYCRQWPPAASGSRP